MKNRVLDSQNHRRLNTDKPEVIKARFYLAATLLPLLLVAFGSTLFIAEKLDAVSAAEEQMAGLEAIEGLNRAVTALQKERGLKHRVQMGEEEAVASLMRQAQQEFESAITRIIEDPGSLRFDLLEGVTTLHEELYRQAAYEPTFSGTILFEDRSRSIDRLLSLIDLAAHNSGLAFDLDPEAHHLTMLSVEQLPAILERLGQFRGIASGFALKDRLTLADHLLMQELHANVAQGVRGLLRHYHAVLRALPNASGYPTLDIVAFVANAETFTTAIINQLRRHRLERDTDASGIFEEATKHLDQGLALQHDAGVLLLDLFEQRQTGLYRSISGTIFISFLVAGILWFFTAGFYRSNQRMLRKLVFEHEQLQQAESERSSSEAFHRCTINAALDGIITIDDLGRVIEFNPAAEQIFGYRNEFAVDRVIDDLIMPSEFRKQHQRFVHSYTDTEMGTMIGKTAELNAVRADGTEISIEMTMSPFQHQGKSMFTAFIRDISQRKQLQEQLQQAQKMEALGRLTGGIAHDFNNMLTSILGYTELARKRLAQYDQSNINDYLGEVHRAGTRARDLVAQMLAFSRSEKGVLTALRLAPLITESLSMLRPSLPSTIEIKLRLDSDDQDVMTTPVKIHQLIMNLCLNARDAMEESGLITIGLQPVSHIVTTCDSCHAPIDGDYIRLSVSDSGPGIVPEQRARIFDPFYTTKEVSKGTGMGLSTVHGIMHDHDGHILVERGSETGTSFVLLFPVMNPGGRGAGQGEAMLETGNR